MKRQAKGIGAANKKRRQETTGTPLAPTITGASAETKEKLAAGYATALPFPHAVLGPICVERKLKEIFKEATTNLNAVLVDTDQCRAFETAPLSSLSASEGEGATLSSLISLRDALYSPDMLALIQSVTLSPTLSPDPDCRIRIYNEGCHRLCAQEGPSDEGSIRFELFLIDPDEPWSPSDGGALELYPPSAHDASSEPAARVYPSFNSLLVWPGGRGPTTAVEEVFTENTRMSITGVFHPASGSAPCPPAVGIPAPGGGDFAATPECVEGALSESDLLYLSEYVAEDYLKKEGHSEIAARFAEESAGSLSGFLLPSLARKISAACIAADTADAVGRGTRPESLTAGQRAGWRVAVPPEARRFLLADPSADCGDAGEVLKKVSKCFHSAAFAKLVAALTGLKVASGRGEVRRFRAGIDYEMATGSEVAEGEYLLDASLTFVDDDGKLDNETGNNKASAADAEEEDEAATKADVWESGVVGGYQCYVEDGEAGPGVTSLPKPTPSTTAPNASSTRSRAAHFPMYANAVRLNSVNAAQGQFETMATGGAGEEEEEEGGPLVKNLVKSNCLNLALREAGVIRFVKYVSAGAPSSRWEVLAEYKVEGAGAEEEEEEEDDASKGGSSSKA